MLNDYRAVAAERAKSNIPPLPLSARQTEQLCALLEQPASADSAELVALLTDRVSPGVDPAAKVKASWLGAVAHGEKASPAIAKTEAIRLLGTMLGGYNIPFLVRELEGANAAAAAKALSACILIFDNFAVVAKLAGAGNAHAQQVIRSWAEGEWFTARPALPAAIDAVVVKIAGETNTDDLSPAQQASSRPDIPLHALAMYEVRDQQQKQEVKFIERMHSARAQGKRLIIAGDVYGTGSSRKSATNSVMWATGNDIPIIPNKRSGAVVLGSIIAPIFLDTFRDAGGLPIQVDVSRLESGDAIRILPREGKLLKNGQPVASFTLRSASIPDEFRAGGRTNLIIGRALTQRAREHLGLGESPLFAKPAAAAAGGKGFSLAQKMVGRACGVAGVRPGTSCEPRMTTVGSQDTTGPMTADELKELACLSFSADLVLQSFCHTAAYPKDVDARMHRWLPEFIVERNGVALRPGDGIIHSWLNRVGMPDTVGTGGDSHTRFPHRHQLPRRLGLGGLRGRDRVHAARHARVGDGALQRHAAARRDAARPGQRHPVGGAQERRPHPREEGQEERLQRTHPRDRRSRDAHRRAGVRAQRRVGRTLGSGLRGQPLREIRRRLPALQCRAVEGDDRRRLQLACDPRAPHRRHGGVAGQAPAPARRSGRSICQGLRDRPQHHHRAAGRLPQRSGQDQDPQRDRQ